MYDQKLINKLAKEYLETKNNQIFGKLLQAIIPVIDTQLAKNYSATREFWDDFRQDVLLKLWQNQENWQAIISIERNPFQFFYDRIRMWLNRSCAKAKRIYDSLNPDAISIEDEEVKHLFY